MMDDLRYPIGRFTRPEALDAGARREAIAAIAALPAEFAAAFDGLDEPQLDTPYRPGGWTLRQLAHHLPDSHANAYVRLKLGLTEDNPAIKPYDEARWAELPDSAAPIAGALALLEALHGRWVRLMNAMDDAAWSRTLSHPESGAWRLDQQLAMYAWHGRHHTAHVTRLRERKGW
jgi:hypothetical protein